jgi:hypothetical protein
MMYKDGIMDGESVERLMDIILQMRMNLGHINETLQQQTYEIRQQLNGVFEEQKRGLEKSLSVIDSKLQECSTSIQDCQRLYNSLAAMREKLVQLGADPIALPAPLGMEPVDEALTARLRQLKELGKL